MERVKRWKLAQIEINEKYDTELTPILVDPLKLYCTHVMFAHVVCTLFNFCGHKFPVKSKT